MMANLLLLGLISFAFGTERSEQQIAKEYVQKLGTTILEKQEKTAKINIDMFAENKFLIKSKKLLEITELEDENDEENDQPPLSRSNSMCEDANKSPKFETDQMEPPVKRDYDTSTDKKRWHIIPEQYKQALWEQYLGYLMVNDMEFFSILCQLQSQPSPLEREQLLYTRFTDVYKPVILAQFIETICQEGCRNVNIFKALAEAVMDIQWVALYLSYKYSSKDLFWHDIDRLETFLINILPAKKRFEFIGHIMEDQRQEFTRRFNSKEIQQEVHQEDGRKFWGRDLYLKAVNRVRIILENEAKEIERYSYLQNYSRGGLKNTLADKIHQRLDYQNAMKQEQKIPEQNKYINELTSTFPNFNIKCVSKTQKESQYLNKNEFEEESDELTEACDYKPEPSTKSPNKLLTASNLTSLGSASILIEENDSRRYFESVAGTVFTACTYDSFFTTATRGTSCITYNTHYQERKNDDRRGIFTEKMIPRAQEARRYADDNNKWERGTIDNTGAGRRWNVIYENQKFVFLPDRRTALTVIPIDIKNSKGKRYKNKK